MESYVDSPALMKCLGFCVTIKHAEFMAARFNEKGILSRVLTGAHTEEEREQTILDLSEGRIKAIFTVDLFNEGVDIPSVNTLLLLRPTKSQSLFIQQLGRGLRIDESSGKSHCVVLDFIGLHRTEFLEENPLLSLGLASPATDGETPRIVHPLLPSNCTVNFERKVEEEILKLTTVRKRGPKKKLSLFHPDGSPVRIAHHAHTRGELKALYNSDLNGKSLTLAQSSISTRPHDLSTNAPAPLVAISRDLEAFYASSLAAMHVSRILHYDDSLRIDALTNIAEGKSTANDPIMNRMIIAELLGSNTVKETRYSSLDNFVEEIQRSETFRQELRDVANILAKDSIASTKDTNVDGLLCYHATYTRMEVTIALTSPSNDRVRSIREGVFYDVSSNRDIFFVTIEKDSAAFTDTTRYRDFAVTPDTFLWDSQNSTRAEKTVGKRYVSNSSEKILFVRKHGKVNGVTYPFTLLGPVDYVSHEGEAPMHITWKLRHEITESMLAQFSKPRHLEMSRRFSG